MRTIIALMSQIPRNRLDSAPELSGKAIFIFSLNNFPTAYFLKGHCHQKSILSSHICHAAVRAPLSQYR